MVSIYHSLLIQVIHVIVIFGIFRHEGLELENPENAPNYDHLLVLSTSPEKAPEEPEHVVIRMGKRIPC